MILNWYSPFNVISPRVIIESILASLSISDFRSHFNRSSIDLARLVSI